MSNYNLYRIGRSFGIAGKMTAHIFDPIVNWMPACYAIGSPDNDDDRNNFSDDDVEIGLSCRLFFGVTSLFNDVPRRGMDRCPEQKEKQTCRHFPEFCGYVSGNVDVVVVYVL